MHQNFQLFSEQGMRLNHQLLSIIYLNTRRKK
ncbi:hypothetical protein EPYR_02711 [Erwinia pyrifoliae DSM 12163]|nr:hypothetical protein EPYR_02711 [Erwinia pyrifoliae DSM 12163]